MCGSYFPWGQSSPGPLDLGQARYAQLPTELPVKLLLVHTQWQNLINEKSNFLLNR